MNPDNPRWRGDIEPPKRGFQIHIPKISELYERVRSYASRSGDTAVDQLRMQYLEWFSGIGGQEPNTLRWDIFIEDPLFSLFEITIAAGYSPNRGEWADLHADLWTRDLDVSWVVARNAEKIVELLRARGVNAALEVGHDEDYHILLPSTDPRENLVLYLGQKNPDDAAAVYGIDQVHEHGNNPILLRPGTVDRGGDLPFDLEGFIRRLHHFQTTVPLAISAIYESMDFTVPDVTIEMSVTTS